MSVNYSAGLSYYEDKGVCGLPEIIDDPVVNEDKIKLLKDWILTSKCVVIHCGAGISTSCGIPDFRGPKGVWTLEQLEVDKKKKSKRQVNTINKESGDEIKSDRQTQVGACISFEDSKPSITHRALTQLINSGQIHFLISQNVDGIFLKTGINRKFISELHGNFFLDECNVCENRFIRSTSSTTMGLKVSTRKCPRPNRPCRGYLRDTILDWEDDLPVGELEKAQHYAAKADLSICLGTSLQIVPAANLPFVCKKRKSNPGKVVIINLQPTKFDHKADLVIHDYVDSAMINLCKLLQIQIPDYDPQKDLTKFNDNKVKVWK